MVITIIEGNELSYILARVFLLFNHKVNIIKHKNGTYIDKLDELGVNVVFGEGTDINILSQPCIQESDIIVSLMDRDADNLVLCLYFKKKFSNKKTITKVINPRYVDKYEQLGIDIAVDYALILSDFVGMNEE